MRGNHAGSPNRQQLGFFVFRRAELAVRLDASPGQAGCRCIATASCTNTHGRLLKKRWM